MHDSRPLPTCPVIGRNEERILAPSVDESAQELPPEVSAASVELRTQHLILGCESVSAGRRGMGQELRCIGSHRSVSLWRIGLRIEWPTLLSHEPINEHTMWGVVEQPIGQRCLRCLETVVEAVLAAGTDCNSLAPFSDLSMVGRTAFQHARVASSNPSSSMEESDSRGAGDAVRSSRTCASAVRPRAPALGAQAAAPSAAQPRCGVGHSRAPVAK